MATDYPRFTLNRHLVFLVPKQPVLDWLASVDDEPGKPLTLEQLCDDNDGFLLPQNVTDSHEQAVKWVEKRWQMFFEHFLDGWVTDESLWPPKLSLKLFREWFDIQYHSMLWDLAELPLEVEDWDEDEEGKVAIH